MKRKILNLFVLGVFLLVVLYFVFSANSSFSLSNLKSNTEKNNTLFSVGDDEVEIFGKKIEKSLLRIYIYFALILVYLIVVLYVAFLQQKIS
jgi:hypothetical protein